LRVTENFPLEFQLVPRFVIAVLLVLGNKAGNDRWYEENVLKADKLYDELLEELNNEGLI